MTKLKILRLLQHQEMKPKELAQEIGLQKVYSHIRSLKDMSLIEKQNNKYRLTPKGIEYLEKGDFSEILPPKLYVDDLTAFMLKHDRPMTARELHEALQDPRTLPDFRAWLSHLIRRKYITIDKTRSVSTYQITARGRLHGVNGAEFRKQRHWTRLY
ncbi:putative transcriptional regulator [Methanolobus tindarius DSM 2278]|uniref:Putative transcriptional regulator n=1 Tax=Methanolobus tindarius DSM 2278 TaxID=1090322 RepID=W9DYS5_METTI|nr:transcriptional regulator [Methanolobus tindarius]ETA68867.1 putative transcriptional regulator [Methanolobus tindarius DSM 2278]